MVSSGTWVAKRNREDQSSLGETGKGMRAMQQRIWGEGGVKAYVSGGPELEKEKKKERGHGAFSRIT